MSKPPIIEQSGSVTPGHLVSWVTDGVVNDSNAHILAFTVTGTPTPGQIPVAQNGVLAAWEDYPKLFDTRVAAIAATILSSFNAIMTQGYTTVGDGGHALYVRGTVSTYGGFQSADGTWWNLAQQTLNIKMFGAKGDSITDDYPAIQEALNLVMSSSFYTPPITYPGNTLYVPTGLYRLISGTPLVTNAVGINLIGLGGWDNTAFLANSGDGAFRTDGAWRCFFQNIGFFELEGVDAVSMAGGPAVFDLDGNIAFPGSTRGVQDCCFTNCAFSADSADFAFAIVRQGIGSGQGSENLFLDCNFFGGSSACFLLNGANAVQNTMIGGNFQSYVKNGIQTNAGNINLFSVGFQSTVGYTQILNGGWDYYGAGLSTGDRTIIDSCRTESLRFATGGGSPLIIRACSQESSINTTWVSGAAQSVLNLHFFHYAPSGALKMYRVTTTGTSGAIEPVWPETGTIADGSVVWTETEFNVIEGGTTNYVSDCFFTAGRLKNAGMFERCRFQRQDLLDPSGTEYLSDNSNTVFRDSYVVLNGNNNPIFPILVGNNAGVGAKFAPTHGGREFDLTDGALMFRAGTGGGTGWDVGIERGGYGIDLRNASLQVIGGLSLQQVTFADLSGGAVVAADGTMFYCTDGTPGAPLAGGGTGSLAVRVNGTWKGL